MTPDGRLPDAAQGNDHLRNIFYRMGYVHFLEFVAGYELTLIADSMIKKLSLSLVLMPSAAAILIDLDSKVPGLSLLLPFRTSSTTSF